MADMTGVPVVAPLLVSLVALYGSWNVQASPPEGETPEEARTFAGAPGAAASPPARLPEDPPAAPESAAADGTRSQVPGARLERQEPDPGADAIRTATSRAVEVAGEGGEAMPGARWSTADGVRGDVAYGARARAAVPGPSTTGAVRGGVPAAAMIVLVRDPRTGALWSLGLSSGGGVDGRIARENGEVWVTLGRDSRDRRPPRPRSRTSHSARWSTARRVPTWRVNG